MVKSIPETLTGPTNVKYINDAIKRVCNYSNYLIKNNGLCLVNVSIYWIKQLFIHFHCTVLFEQFIIQKNSFLLPKFFTVVTEVRHLTIYWTTWMKPTLHGSNIFICAFFLTKRRARKKYNSCWLHVFVPHGRLSFEQVMTEAHWYEMW
jgi:hypothetical protein